MGQTCCNSDTPSGHKLEGCRIDRAGGHREPTRRSRSPALRQRVRPYHGEDLWGRQEPASLPSGSRLKRRASPRARAGPAPLSGGKRPVRFRHTAGVVPAPPAGPGWRSAPHLPPARSINWRRAREPPRTRTQNYGRMRCAVGKNRGSRAVHMIRCTIHAREAAPRPCRLAVSARILPARCRSIASWEAL